MLRVLGERRANRLQVFEHGPVKLLGDAGVAPAVGVREGVALRGGRTPDAVHLRFVKPQRVADLVQAGRARQLPVEQGEDVAEGRELPDVGSGVPAPGGRRDLQESTGRSGAAWCTLFSLALGVLPRGADERVQPRFVLVLFACGCRLQPLPAPRTAFSLCGKITVNCGVDSSPPRITDMPIMGTGMLPTKPMGCY